MKKYDIEEKIRSSFSDETPDILPRIMAACDEKDADSTYPEIIIGGRGAQGNKRSTAHYITVAASMVVVFILGLVLGNMMMINSKDQGDIIDPAVASVYIDVNPSIEMEVTENGTVISCIPANDDAKIIIGDMQLGGVNIKTALNAIIGSMYMNGYMNEDSNSMLVSVNSGNDEKFEGLLCNIVSDVNDIIKASGISCSIVAQDVMPNDRTSSLARENNISVGKMSLINKIIESAEDYTDEDIAELAMSAIKDLNEIYAFVNMDREHPDEDNKKPEGDRNEQNKNEVQSDIISGVLDKVEGNKEGALKLALKYLSSLFGTDVDEDDLIMPIVLIRRESERGEGGFKSKYVYEVKFAYGLNFYELDVDLDTESVTDARRGNNDKKPHGTLSDEAEDKAHGMRNSYN